MAVEGRLPGQLEDGFCTWTGLPKASVTLSFQWASELRFPTFYKMGGAASHSGPLPKGPLSRQPCPSVIPGAGCGKQAGVLQNSDTTQEDPGPHVSPSGHFPDVAPARVP